jgi:large subunit ribosomal protein L2
MALKTYNPVTPGQRQLVLVDRSALYSGKPVKALTEGKNSTGGRNNNGHITSRYRGGGHKQAYRKIDFKRRKFDAPAKVERLEYDPNRTAFIALIKYDDGELDYILAPQRISVGDTVVAGEHVDVKPGNAMPAANIPVGTIVHNIEIKIGKGGQIARSAGTYAQIVGRDGEYVILRLNSGEQRLVHGRCIATVGAVSNPDNMNISIGKAGRSRWMGRRGHVRGETGDAVGQADQGQEDAQEQAHREIHHGKPPRAEEDIARVRSDHGAFGLERPVCRRLSAEKGGYLAFVRPPRDDPYLVAAFDHPAAIRRADLRRLQRPEAHPGGRHRGNGRPQIR